MTRAPVAPEVVTVHQAELPCLRLAISRTLGDHSFEVENVTLEAKGETAEAARRAMAWLLLRLPTVRVPVRPGGGS